MKNSGSLFTFLESLKDDFSQLEKCVDLLYDLQKNRGPIAEAVTVLKYDKPVLHTYLLKRLQNNPGLSMILKLTMSYEDAKQRLMNE